MDGLIKNTLPTYLPTYLTYLPTYIFNRATPNLRGAGALFGADVASTFMKVNGFSMVIVIWR